MVKVAVRVTVAVLEHRHHAYRRLATSDHHMRSILSLPHLTSTLQQRLLTIPTDLSRSLSLDIQQLRVVDHDNITALTLPVLNIFLHGALPAVIARLVAQGAQRQTLQKCGRLGISTSGYSMSCRDGPPV